MQIIRPDILPLFAGVIILLLFLIGLIGLILFYKGIKNITEKKLSLTTFFKVVLGAISIGFVLSNWIGYNAIFSKNELLLVGEYYSDNYKLTINEDYTWKITENNKSIFKHGKWEYKMSEDWCYWNIESDNLMIITQIGTPKIGFPPLIEFKDHNLLFKRKNDNFQNKE
ncbi:MAG: hypothetical protein KA734_07635 [Fluviicola sp.]|nr:hypothetical protein [Fluviicola sp.]